MQSSSIVNISVGKCFLRQATSRIETRAQKKSQHFRSEGETHLDMLDFTIFGYDKYRSANFSRRW